MCGSEKGRCLPCGLKPLSPLEQRPGGGVPPRPPTVQLWKRPWWNV